MIVVDQSDTSFAMCSQPFHYSLPGVNVMDYNGFFRSLVLLNLLQVQLCSAWPHLQVTFIQV